VRGPCKRPSTVCPHFLHGHVVSRAVVSALPLNLEDGWTAAITQLSSNGLLTQRVQHICGAAQEQTGIKHSATCQHPTYVQAGLQNKLTKKCHLVSTATAQGALTLVGMCSWMLVRLLLATTQG
jgi:hypothetical protein